MPIHKMKHAGRPSPFRRRTEHEVTSRWSLRRAKEMHRRKRQTQQNHKLRVLGERTARRRIESKRLPRLRMMPMPQFTNRPVRATRRRSWIAAAITGLGSLGVLIYNGVAVLAH